MSIRASWIPHSAFWRLYGLSLEAKRLGVERPNMLVGSIEFSVCSSLWMARLKRLVNR